MKILSILFCFIILFTVAGSAQMVITNTDETELMRVTNDGKVGIGTSTPDAGLHVAKGGAKIQNLGQHGDVPVMADNTGMLYPKSHIYVRAYADADNNWFVSSHKKTMVYDVDNDPENFAMDEKNVYNNTNGLFQPGEAGFYYVSASASFMDVDGRISIYFHINDKTVWSSDLSDGRDGPNDANRGVGSTIVYLDENDYLEVEVVQDNSTGTNRKISIGENWSYWSNVFIAYKL